MGRAPLPTAIKILNGNPGKKKLPENEPTPSGGLGKPPRELQASAKKIWKTYAPVLEQIKVGTEADIAIFEGFCRSYALWQQLRTEGEKNPIVKINGQPVANPALSRADKEYKQWSAAAIQLGLTPAARSRIAAQAPEEADDALAAFARKRTPPATPPDPAGGIDG